ncbi:hypothetical protein O6P43_005982 [Quillaja saponaria]|uniref:Uncharacterized protein n=1 Tax=Quillaja saponaria TaxID=32244 RepID=A0AAD7VHY8_QUISA|nr:hypothetical protein O6P43_005982 [Quillaja saponaria]
MVAAIDHHSAEFLFHFSFQFPCCVLDAVPFLLAMGLLPKLPCSCFSFEVLAENFRRTQSAGAVVWRPASCMNACVLVKQRAGRGS